MYFIISGLTSWLSSSIDFHIDTTVSPGISSAFRSQIKLGLESLLHNLFSKKLIQQQQQHYSSINSRKLGTRWGIRLTGKLWSFIQQIWIHRNNILHNTPSIDFISGKEHLVSDISSGHEAGLATLPRFYATYFLTPLHLLLSKPLKYQIRWFLLIRSGRRHLLLSPQPTTFQQTNHSGNG